MDKADDTMQRKILLNSLMSSAGMKELRADMADDMAYADAQVKAGKGGFISSGGLDRLNFYLGVKSGLEMVLNRLANYEDELVGSDVKGQEVKGK